ncbi:DNA-binding PadR family transcriptional regulator [Friedmanniella endophytica]|uniref:DNA-binding PadR family transcriptional regulator n=1 Tax=Microlunatus kandeliicorticis TaxID=1759536 RepID=A0A7W3P5Y5_9ACTN|nr:PadR family transcriptional regulator [Microlunatus kandeliicorticis]MBA8794382.1 DNA-binding PadR family transcriptional regulator [Microlunatus kandeliicorticis]
MSLRFALLGLLDVQPSSGYDLTQRFARGIGSYAWSAKHSQIYPELRKLTDEGLIEITETGARGRKTYAPTPAGREELRGWLLGKPNAGGARNEFVLRLFLLSSLEPEEAVAVLDGTLRFAREQEALLEQEFAAAVAEAGVPSGSSPGLAARYGIHSYRALAEWADWARAAIAGDPTFGHRR